VSYSNSFRAIYLVPRQGLACCLRVGGGVGGWGSCGGNDLAKWCERKVHLRARELLAFLLHKLSTCRYLVKGTLEGYKPGQKNRATTKHTKSTKGKPYSKYEIKRTEYSSKRVRYSLPSCRRYRTVQNTFLLQTRGIGNALTRLTTSKQFTSSPPPPHTHTHLPPSLIMRA